MSKYAILHMDYKSWLNLQYPHSGLSFIDIMGSNMIKIVICLFHAILSYFVYHTLVEINIM
jgi:hypothetical protein